MEKKYKLPPYAKIKKLFWVEEEEFSEVCKSVTRELRGLSDYFESLITAGYYKTFVERNFLSDREKEWILDVYKQIQIMLIEERIAKLSGSEKEYCKWFNKAVKFWEDILPRLKKLLEKLKTGWKKYKVKINGDEGKLKYHF